MLRPRPRRQTPGPRHGSPRNKPRARMFRCAAGMLVLAGLGACSTTLADCFDLEAARLSTNGAEAHLPPGCEITGTSANGVATLACDGGREGFMVLGADRAG